MGKKLQSVLKNKIYEYVPPISRIYFHNLFQPGNPGGVWHKNPTVRKNTQTTTVNQTTHRTGITSTVTPKIQQPTPRPYANLRESMPVDKSSVTGFQSLYKFRSSCSSGNTPNSQLSHKYTPSEASHVSVRSTPYQLTNPSHHVESRQPSCSPTASLKLAAPKEVRISMPDDHEPRSNYNTLPASTRAHTLNAHTGARRTERSCCTIL